MRYIVWMTSVKVFRKKYSCINERLDGFLCRCLIEFGLIKFFNHILYPLFPILIQTVFPVPVRMAGNIFFFCYWIMNWVSLFTGKSRKSCISPPFCINPSGSLIHPFSIGFSLYTMDLNHKGFHNKMFLFPLYVLFKQFACFTPTRRIYTFSTYKSYVYTCKVHVVFPLGTLSP